MLFALLTSIAATTAAHPGIGIVMNSRGNVYYTDLKSVWRVAPDGSRKVVVAGVHTHELCLDAEDNLYGEHLWYEGDATGKWGHRVWRLSPRGQLTDVIPAREGFLRNYSFVRDHAGNMYWADRGHPTIIRKRTPDGRIADLAAHEFRDVRWMTAAPGGTVFLTDLHDLVRISPDGSMRVLARGLAEMNWTQRLLPPDRHAVMGLWTDPQEYVYAAILALGVVKRISPDGRVEVIARSPPGWKPTGGLVAPNGDLWLLEGSPTNSVRVRRIARDGSSKTFP